MKSNRFKILYRHIALLLCAILVFTSPGTNVFADELPGGNTAVNTVGDVDSTNVKDGKYIVDVSRANRWEDINKAPTVLAGYRLQIDGKGVVEKTSDGKYHVRLRYAGYHVYDAIQVVDPKKDADVLEYCKTNKITVANFPAGTFNVPKTAEGSLNPTNFSKYIESAVKEEVNSYYLPESEVRVTCPDPKMDWGQIEFDVDDLSQYVIIVPVSSVTGTGKTVIVGLDQDSLTSVPDSLTYKPGEYSMYYEWTNYPIGSLRTFGNPFDASVPPVTTYNVGGRNNSGVRGDEPGNSGVGTLDRLNNIFEKDVKVTVAEDGTMSAVFTINKDALNDISPNHDTSEPDPVTSIELAVSRDTSAEGLKALNDSFSATMATNETVSTQYTTLLSGETVSDTVTIPFKDLAEGGLIKVSTRSLDEANKPRLGKPNGYRYINAYYGRLWLTSSLGAVAKGVTITAANGAVLRTDTNTFKPGDKFICEDKYPHPDESSKDTLLAFCKDDNSYKEYSYWIEDAKGQRKVPVSPVTIDLPIPDNMAMGAESDSIFMWSSLGKFHGKGGSYDMPPGSNFVKNEKGGWVLRISPVVLKDYDWDIFMGDSGSKMTWNEMQSTFEKGKYYEVRALLGNAGEKNRPSMAAALLSGRKVQIHVTEDGTIELYAKLQGVKVGTYGYVAKMFYDTVEKTQLPVETLSYKTTANIPDEEYDNIQAYNPKESMQKSEDDLAIDPLAKSLGAHYLNVIKMPLDKPNEPADKPAEWILDVVVPMMNVLLTKDPAALLKDQKNLKLMLVSGSAKEVDPSKVYSYDKSLLLGTIEDAESDHDKLPEGAQKSSLKAAIDKATATYKELKTSFDTNTLLRAVRELETVIPEKGVQTLQTGTWRVPMAVINENNNSSTGLPSPFAKNFGDAVVTIDDKTMTVKLATKTVDGGSVTGLQYTSAAGKFQNASPVLDSLSNVTGYTFTRPYTEEAFLTQFTVSGVPYLIRAYMTLDVNHAARIMSSDEAMAQLKELVKDSNAILAKEDSAALYTSSSLEALSAAVKKAQTIIDSGAQAEETAIETQITDLTAAKEGLKLKTAVKDQLKAALDSAKSYITQTDKYTAESIGLLQTAVNSAESIYNSYDNSEAAMTKAEAAIKDMQTAIGQLKGMSGEVNNPMQTLKELVESLKNHDGNAYETTSEAAFEASLKAAQAVLNPDRGYEVSDEQAAAQLDALKKEQAALVDFKDIGSIIGANLRLFLPAPYEPNIEGGCLQTECLTESRQRQRPRQFLKALQFQKQRLRQKEPQRLRWKRQLRLQLAQQPILLLA